MKLSGMFRLTVLLGLITIAFLASLSAQKAGCKSSTVNGESRCANILVEFADLTTSKLQGKVRWPAEGPVLVEVFKVPKSDRKKDGYSIGQMREADFVIETDREGNFCHPGLEEGFYVLKFGTTDGGWNCSWIKVRIVHGAPARKVKVELTIGI